AEAHLQSSRDKLQKLDEERSSLTASFQMRERSLQQQLEQIERDAERVKEALEEKLILASQQSALKQGTQEAIIAELESGQADASAHLAALQKKLAQIEKERDALAETLRARETVLLKQLEEKERAWTHSSDALKAQLAALKEGSTDKDQAQQALIGELEQ